MKIKCQVVEDLLPLYIDGVCSEESKKLVEEHLNECRTCLEKYRNQTSDIPCDSSFIKENLKAKEPFKKIKKFYFRKLLLILLCIPILYLGVVEIGGDGVGFSALAGRYKAERFFTYIEKGEFSDAVKYLGVSGGVYQTFADEGTAKKAWIDRMQKLSEEGIKILSHRENDIKTDDRFTAGYITLSIGYGGEIYGFKIFVSTNKGKVEPARLSDYPRYPFRELSDVEKMLMDKVSKVMSTYNPG